MWTIVHAIHKYLCHVSLNPGKQLCSILFFICINPLPPIKENFPLQYQYYMKYSSHENEEKYKFGDY